MEIVLIIFYLFNLLNPLNPRLYLLIKSSFRYGQRYHGKSVHSEGFIHRYLNPNAIYLIEQHKTIIHQILLAGKTLVVPNTMADNNALLLQLLQYPMKLLT